MTGRKPPREHPVAWQSPLWAHHGTIRELRQARKSWPQVAEHLEREHGLKVTWRTVRRFFARATKRAKSGKLPLGFTAPEPAKAPAPPPPVVAPTHDPFSIEPEAPRPAALFEKTRKRLEQQRLEQEKQTRINEQHP